MPLKPQSYLRLQVHPSTCYKMGAPQPEICTSGSLYRAAEVVTAISSGKLCVEFWRRYTSAFSEFITSQKCPRNVGIKQGPPPPKLVCGRAAKAKLTNKERCCRPICSAIQRWRWPSAQRREWRWSETALRVCALNYFDQTSVIKRQRIRWSEAWDMVSWSL